MAAGVRALAGVTANEKSSRVAEAPPFLPKTPRRFCLAAGPPEARSVTTPSSVVQPMPPWRQPAG
jgi:hypothetical protein